jgi:hypothetical protein
MADDVVLTVKLETNDAERQADALKGKVDEVGKAADGSSSKTSSFLGEMGKLAGGATIALGTLALAFKGISSAVSALAAEGEKLGSLKDGFDALGGSSQAIEEARKASLGLIKETDLLAIANKGLIMGLPDMNENFGKIAEAGTRLANTLGGDAKEKTQQLMEAIARGRTPQLQQLGLIVDQDKAWADYARSNGLAVNEMTRSQKQVAIQKAAMAELNNFLNETAEATDSVANAQASLSNTFSNTFGAIGEVVNSNDQLRLAYRSLEQSVIDNKESLMELADFIVTKFAHFMTGLAEIIDWVSKNWKGLYENFQLGAQIIKEAVLPYLEAFQAGLQEITKALNTAKDAFNGWRENFSRGIAVITGKSEEYVRANQKAAKSTVTLSDFGQKLYKVWRDSIPVAKDQAVAVEGTAKALDKQGSEISTVTERMRRLNDEQSKSFKDSKAIEDSIKKQTDEFKKLADAIDDITGQSLRSQGIKLLSVQLQDLLRGVNEATFQTPEMAKEIKQLADDFVAAGNDAKDFLDTLNKVAQAGDLKVGVEIAPEVTGSSALADQLTGYLGSALDALADYINTGKVNKPAVGQAIGSMIGSIFGMEEVGGMIGGFVGKIWDKVTGKTKHFHSISRRQLQTEINEFLKKEPIQIRLGEDLFQYSFLGLPNKDVWKNMAADGAGTLFDEWVREIMARAPQVYSTYTAVFGAMGQNLFGDFGVGAQVGAVIMDQFGDSIDNLRLLVQVLGVSFEDLEQGIIDAFLSGQLGALEAASALRDLPEAFKPGLAAVGDMIGAMDNLIQSAGRGRTAIKSLQDLAYEAMEAGVTSLDGLQQHLIASGRFTEDQIAQLFTALNMHGITSLEQLTNVSDGAAIAILGSLEAMGGFFAEVAKGFEEAIQQADKLEERLNRLDNASAETNLTIKVRTQYLDSGAEAALNQVDREGAGQYA